MSNEEYTHQNYWTNHNICIEKDKNGKCLVSARYVFLELNDKEQKQVHELFCGQIKKIKDDKTI